MAEKKSAQKPERLGAEEEDSRRVAHEKTAPKGGFSFFCQQRTGFKRRPDCVRPGWVPESSGGECQVFHLGSQAALVTSGLVFVEDALVSNDVHHGLHLAKHFSGFDFVAGLHGFFDILHRGAVFGAQRAVRFVEFHVLTGAFAA